MEASLRSVICDIIPDIRLVCSSIVVVAGGGEGGRENEGEAGSDVWTPMSRWNSSVGSLSLSSSSGSSWRGVAKNDCGVSDTIPWSLAINLSRFSCAVPVSSCRDEVKAAIMGVIK